MRTSAGTILMSITTLKFIFVAALGISSHFYDSVFFIIHFHYNIIQIYNFRLRLHGIVTSSCHGSNYFFSPSITSIPFFRLLSTFFFDFFACLWCLRASTRSWSLRPNTTPIIEVFSCLFSNAWDLLGEIFLFPWDAFFYKNDNVA